MVRTHFIIALALASQLHAAEDLGEMWGTAAEEAKYYPIVNIPIPPTVPMRPGGLEILPDGRLAVGTRRGDIRPVDFGGTPWAPRSMAPEHGEHTDAILAEIGRSPAEITRLRESGIVA